MKNDLINIKRNEKKRWGDHILGAKVYTTACFFILSIPILDNYTNESHNPKIYFVKRKPTWSEGICLGNMSTPTWSEGSGSRLLGCFLGVTYWAYYTTLLVNRDKVL